MYYTVYKITNLLNGKIYIGVHKTDNLDDNYMGSGKHLKRSQEKYGIENFEKEILQVFDNAEDMFNMESELVNEDFVSRDDTYNLKLGGSGGFDFINSDKESITKRNQNISSNRDYSDLNYIKKLKTSLADRNMPTRFNGIAFSGPHSEETKIKISNSNKGKFLGTDNSQYGTIWIYNLELKVCKKIKKEELQSYKENGWLKGRKMKF